MTRALSKEQRQALVAALRAAHTDIRKVVMAFCEGSSASELARPIRNDRSDTIYGVDAALEEQLPEIFERHVGRLFPFLLVGEGLPENLRLGNRPRWQVPLRILVDPIDGSRMIMFQKRSAWILTGVAPDLGPQTRLDHIEVAVQTEIPTEKQHLADQLWATADTHTAGARWNRVTGTEASLSFSPSSAATFDHQFLSVIRFLPGARELLGRLDDLLFQRLKIHAFEDQYLSAGGQLYELIVGHDLLIADFRPLIKRKRAGQPGFDPLCAHPYDLCTELVARQAGVVVTNEQGQQLTAPLDVQTDVCWIAYANRSVRAQIEPIFQEILFQLDLIH